MEKARGLGDATTGSSESGSYSSSFWNKNSNRNRRGVDLLAEQILRAKQLGGVNDGNEQNDEIDQHQESQSAEEEVEVVDLDLDALSKEGVQ